MHWFKRARRTCLFLLQSRFTFSIRSYYRSFILNIKCYRLIFFTQPAMNWRVFSAMQHVIIRTKAKVSFKHFIS